MTALLRFLLISGGFVSLGLGVIGALLPLLPTTPFLLVAAFCFARSSERFHAALMQNRWSGPYIRNYRDGTPMTPTQLATTLIALWVSLSATAILLPVWWVPFILLAVAIGVTTYLVWRNRRLRAARPESDVRSPGSAFPHRLD